LKTFALDTLEYDNDQLTSPDLDTNTALSYLGFNNQLTCLNFKNGKNYNISSIRASQNPNLACVKADDAAWPTAN
jgi:hypothetical protein